MVDFLNTWAQRIITVVIISTIIEMILPEGNNKKYIKLVAGIYVTFTIIGPIISKLNTKEDLNFKKYFNLPKQNTIETSINIDNTQYVEDIYKEKLSEDIKTKINAMGYDVKSIVLKIETQKKEIYGNILALSLKIGQKQQEKENNIKIEPIIIGKEEVKEESKISPEEVEKIKSYLEEIYYIDKEKIEIE